MISSYFEARNELFKQLFSIASELESFLTYKPLVVYQGVENPGKVPTDKLWMRISQQTVLEGQATLTGNDLKRRYNTNGLVFIQVFVPKTRIEDYAIGLQLAVLIKNAFRGKQTENCIWFNNTRIQELPAEDAWNRINIVSEYQYNEIG